MTKATVCERPVLRLAAVLSLALVAASACEDDVITDVTGERPVLHVAFSPAGGALPGGAFNLRIDYVIDLTIPDAFDRATGDTYRYGDCLYTTGGAVGELCWHIPPEDILDATRDRRLPALTGSGVTVVDDNDHEFLNILGPEIWGGPFYNYWTIFEGLPPNQRFYVGLWRAAIEVNAELDAAAVLTGAEITEPDRLVSAGGTPGGNSERPADQFTDAPGAPFPAEPNANPWVFGYIQSDEEGAAKLDVLISPNDAAGGVVHNDHTSTDPARWPFALNGPGQFQPWQYNYLVVWAEDPLANPDAEQVIRIQLAPDVVLGSSSLDAAGNTFAPYPAGALSAAEIAQVPGFRGAAPTRLQLRLTNLPELASPAVYKAWLVDLDGGGAPIPAPGVLTVTEGGQTTEVGTQATWTGGIGAEATFTISDATLGTELRPYTHVLVAVQSSDGSSPGTPSFWARFADHKGTPQDFTDNEYTEAAQLQIGALDLSNPSASRVYAPAGTLRGSFFKDSLFVVAEGAALPPPGFHYEMWLEDPAASVLYRVGGIGLDARGNGVVKVPEAQVDGFGRYTNVAVTLEPDMSAAPQQPGPARIFESENWVDKYRGVFRAQ
ncbi:MAG TPA: hypothetical protein VIL18_12315 [Longimicrobiales bacterium]